jgi:predicted DNA-binding antitoxin AbrB/MazE fold protein
MTSEIDAIYENGVFKPLVPLSLPDKAQVRLTVSSSADANVHRDAIDRETAPTANGAYDGFDAELDELLFDGPSLPADFSRADIYADHD